MAKGIKLHVWSDYALFTRPEMKAERVSYDIMTPSAARGIVSAIYWKPQIRWIIARIHVLKPVQFTSIRRNEVSSKATTPSSATMSGQPVDPVGIDVEMDRQQRASLVLRDVSYVIEAHFELAEPVPAGAGSETQVAELEAKHISMFNRRARMGQFFHQPCMGCREFPAHFQLIEKDTDFPSSSLPESQRNKDYGYVFHDFVFEDDPKGKIIDSNNGKHVTATPKFFRAATVDGIVVVPQLTAKEVLS